MRAETAKSDTEGKLKAVKAKLEDVKTERDTLADALKRARNAIELSVMGQREAERQSEMAMASFAFAEEMRIESERCVVCCAHGQFYFSSGRSLHPLPAHACPCVQHVCSTMSLCHERPHRFDDCVTLVTLGADPGALVAGAARRHSKPKSPTKRCARS